MKTRRRTSTGFLLIIVICVATIVIHNLKRYYVDKSYVVTVITSCDPVLHNCFETDPNNPDPNLSIPVYEKVEVTAFAAPTCLDEHTCRDFSCEGVKGMCSITYCIEDSKDPGEFCATSSK
jgi:hypothetical protein